MNEIFENAPITPKSSKAEKILIEIKLVNLAVKQSKIKLTFPVLGAGKHNIEDYKKRELVKKTIEDFGHNAFFPEEITVEETKTFLRSQGLKNEIAIEALVGNEERKNDSIINCCELVFVLVAGEGSLVEIGKCCKTGNEEKLRILVPEDKYDESSQVMQTLNELKINHNNVYTFKNDNDLKGLIKEIMTLELTRRFRNN